MLKKYFLAVYLLTAVTAFAQSNFTYSPEKPRPGDVITFTYEPAGVLLGSLKPVEALAYQMGTEARGMGANVLTAEDVALTRQGKKYTSTVKTDTAASFVCFGFSADGKWDNNFDEGYYILLYESDKPRKNSYASLSQFHLYLGTRVGLTANYEKALMALAKEMELYPENRKNNLFIYAWLLSRVKKDSAAVLIQREIEALLKTGLKTEDDYVTLESLYQTAKLPQQAKLITGIRKEKFPQGKWVANEAEENLYQEKDPTKAEALAAEIAQKIKTDPAWKHLEPFAENYNRSVLNAYIQKKDWTGLKKAAERLNIKQKGSLASLYNNAAWGMQERNENLQAAEEISRFATEWAKAEMTKPTEKKPPYLTTKQWEKQRKGTYGMYADTYAMVLYRLGQYKKGFVYAKDALAITEGKQADYNNTYALLAEKALPLKQYKKQLEDFVKTGASTSEIKAILKRAYQKEKGSDTGFDDYIAALEKESYLKMIAELRKSMLNETAPPFALLDLDSNKVSLADLKGKTVVVDFWATWCGPCIAPFPGMQKVVTKYKDDPNVKFIFIDTWEQGDNKKRNAADFITNNKYSFHVLLDEDNKVVEQFKVEGIPTKFVIDKNGVIRFKSVGFDGSDDKLVAELTAMIELANGSMKTF